MIQTCITAGLPTTGKEITHQNLWKQNIKLLHFKPWTTKKKFRPWRVTCGFTLSHPLMSPLAYEGFGNIQKKKHRSLPRRCPIFI
jgi:hypothetical protein